MPKLLRLARMQFLLASLGLFTLGAVWAVLSGAPLTPLRLLLGYLVIFLAHLSVSFSNDYFDVAIDALGVPTFISGGSGILVQHPQLRPTALRIAIGLTLGSLALGILVVLLFPIPAWFLAFVAAGNLAGWAYSAPPLRLSYRGLGEISTAFTSGFLVPVMGYVVARGTLDLNGLLFVPPALLFGLVFILAVEIPDEEVDRRGGKRTWVARRGRVFGFALIGILLLGISAYFFSLARPTLASNGPNFSLLGLATLPALLTAAISLVAKPTGLKQATCLANYVVATTAAFFIMTDGYLIYLATKLTG